MKIKNKYKKIFLLLVIILISGLLLNSTYAAITVGAGEVDTVKGKGAVILQTLMKVLESPVKGLLSPISWTIVLLNIILFLLLWVIFVAGTGTVWPMPFPDEIVFNRFPFFDVNFINPANNSLLNKMGDILANLFESFQTVAIALFVVAAMVAGIKMALSTIASKKAQYKEAAMKWITGFIILLCLRYIIAGIFYLNEYLVATLYGIAANIKIPMRLLNAIPSIYQPLQGLWSDLAAMGMDDGGGLPGYLGIVVANLAKAIGGDIIASVVGFVIMGQTITIAGSYIKRLFMSVLLGLISPMIVAADTVVAVQGKQSNIFKNWLKNFTLTVFMQSVHALYMVVTLQILDQLYSENELVHLWDDIFHQQEGATAMNFYQIGIITIVLTTGLIKLEKMFKTLFGLGDSLAGDLRDGAKGMLQAMGAARGLGAGIAAVSDNRKKASEAGKRRKALDKAIDALQPNKGGGNTTSTGQGSNETKGSTNDSTNSNTSNNNQSNSNGKYKPTGDIVEDAIKEQQMKDQSELSVEKRRKILEAARDKEAAKERAGQLANVMGVANLVGGLGIGLGMGDDIGESLFKGGYLTKGLDYVTERIGYGMGSKSYSARGTNEGTNHSSGTPTTNNTTVNKQVSYNVVVNNSNNQQELSKTMEDIHKAEKQNDKNDLGY